ncbi:MAG: polymer-forming cytoskeletal protein [Kiritimatiellales bacterium]
MRDSRFGIVLAVLLSVQCANAIEFVQRDTFISSDAETLRDEMWISAQTITISGDALDDLFAAGNVLDLRGNFKGAVWCGGDQVIAAGRFSDNTRLAGRTTQVSGTLNGSLTAMGNTIKIAPSATIAKNMLCVGENVISEGTVTGNARIVAKQATLGGKVAGNVSIAAQEIVILPGTVIGGNLSYTAPKELVLSPSVILNGELTRTFDAPPPKQFLKTNLLGHFGFAIAALLTGLVFSSLFPRYTVNTLHLLHTAHTPCLLTGFAALFLIPISAFLLLFTFIGLPLSILLILFYCILLYLSKIAVGFWLGALILRRKEITKQNRVLTLATGLLIIYSLTAFTAISMVVNILVAVAGLGALLLALFRKPVLILQTPNDIKQPTTEG